MSSGGEQTRIREGQSLLEGEQGAAKMNPSLWEDAKLATLKKVGRKIHPGRSRCFTIL